MSEGLQENEYWSHHHESLYCQGRWCTHSFELTSRACILCHSIFDFHWKKNYSLQLILCSMLFKITNCTAKIGIQKKVQL